MAYFKKQNKGNGRINNQKGDGKRLLILLEFSNAQKHTLNPGV